VHYGNHAGNPLVCPGDLATWETLMCGPVKVVVMTTEVSPSEMLVRVRVTSRRNPIYWPGDVETVSVTRLHLRRRSIVPR
jgi:hypothetical protein